MGLFIFIAAYRFFSSGMQGFSSLTRDQTQAPCIGSHSHWTKEWSNQGAPYFCWFLIYHKMVILLVFLHGNHSRGSPRTEEPQGLQSMGSQRVRHDWATKHSTGVEGRPWSIRWRWRFSRQVVSDSCNPMDCSVPGSSVHGDSPGKNTGEGCHALFQGIFLTQRSNPTSVMCSSLAGRFFTNSTTRETHIDTVVT